MTHTPAKALRCAMSLIVAGTFVTADAQTRTAASQPVIYPAKGQSEQQQKQDKYECYEWAKAQSGFDPSQPAPAMAVPTTTTSGTTSSGPAGVLPNAARGATIARLGDHDAGKGAAVGALGGAMRERLRARQASQAEAQQMAQQVALQQTTGGQQHAAYDRALGACMEGRGYTVR